METKFQVLKSLQAKLCITNNHIQFYKEGVIFTGYSSRAFYDERSNGNWTTLIQSDNSFSKSFRNEVLKARLNLS